MFTMPPYGSRKNETKLWYYALQGCLDLFVVIEVAFRWAYHGREFCRMWESYVDIAIIILCVGATITEHLPGLKEDQVEDSIAMSCRIVRDAIRILRVVVLMCWLSRSVVEFREEEEEPMDLENGWKNEPMDVKREHALVDPLLDKAIYVHRIDPLSDRGLYDSTPGSSVNSHSPGGFGWRRGDIVGDAEASSSSNASSLKESGPMNPASGGFREHYLDTHRSPRGRSGSFGRGGRFSRANSYSSLGSVGEAMIYHDPNETNHVRDDDTRDQSPPPAAAGSHRGSAGAGRALVGRGPAPP